MDRIRIAKAGVFILALIAAWSIRGYGADVYMVDGPHSSARFRVKNMAFLSVSGTFDEISGKVLVDQVNPASSTVEIYIETASIDTHIRKRDDDLRSEGFFNVAKYPQMSFKSREVRRRPDGKFDVKGDFTLRGVTRPLTVVVEKIGAGAAPTSDAYYDFKTQFTISRNAYGMTKDSSLIADKVNIWLTIRAARKE